MADVAIVGGGIIGAACASELARRGMSVTLIERDELAAHASGRNQGLWVIPGDDATLAMAQLSLKSYLELAEDSPIDVQLDREPLGLVMVARDDDEAAAGRAAVEVAERAGTRVDVLDVASAREVEPGLAEGLAAVWLVHHGHRLDPGALTVALALEAGEHGATIRHHLYARALARRDGKVVGVVTDEGVVEADFTVVAAGPWSPALLDPIGVGLPIVGARGWLVRVSPPPGLLRHLVEAVGPHAALRTQAAPRRPTAGEVVARGLPGSDLGTIVHPHRDGTVLIGSSRETWLTPEPQDAAAVRSLLDAAIGLVPALSEAEMVSSWWGIRPLSPDERPFVGWVHEGLVVATGHGSEGVILGGGTAALVASKILGEDPPFDPAPFEPLRFQAGPPDSSLG
jgi:glycine/D-amino acid oxidase-like deaminating enzyme